MERTCIGFNVILFSLFCFVLGFFLVSLLFVFVLVIALKFAITLLCNCAYYYYSYYCVLQNSVQFSHSNSDLVLISLFCLVFSLYFVRLGLCITVDFVM